MWTELAFPQLFQYSRQRYGNETWYHFSVNSLRPVRSGEVFGGMPKGWIRIARRAGFSDVTLHTLRHSFASVAGDLGYTEPTIAAMLGHATGSVTSRYIHHLDSVLVAAADKVALTILDMMSTDHHRSTGEAIVQRDVEDSSHHST